MERYYNDILIDKILLIMDRKGLTKVALAKRLHMNKQTLSNYLLKHRPIPYEVAIQIAKELDININQLNDLSNVKIDEEEYAAYLKFKKLFHEFTNK